MPDVIDPISIPTGTATQAGPLVRAADTTIGSSGTLAVTDGNFVNAQNGEAAVRLDGGTFTHSGAFFIVGNNSSGSLVQTGGSLTAAVTEAWYLSDVGGSAGSYRMEGGELNVTLSGGSGLERQVHIGKQNSADLFLLDGGTANFNATSANRRFYISRNGTLRIDSGTLNASGFRFFLVGREAAGATNSQLVMNGGALHISAFPGDGAFIVGAGNAGVFFLNDGDLTIESAPMWLGDGGGAGTVVQSDGSITMGGNIVLGRAAGGRGQYFMKGGELTAGSIAPGPGVDSYFFFESGEITLAGDQRTIVEEPWFVESGTVTASYDGTADLTTLSAVPLDGHDKSFRWFRFTATRLRDVFGTAIQLSEFEFLNDGTPIDASAVSVTNEGGDNPEGEDVENLVDGDVATKWLDGANQPVVFDFGAPVTIDGYRFTTGNDAPERDPVRWVLEGSDDGETWTVIDRTIGDHPTPFGRRISTLDLPLPDEAPEEPEILALEWTGAVSAEWDTASLNWMADGAPLAWDNASAFEAVFGAIGSKEIAVLDPIQAATLAFDAAGYTLSGGGWLELSEPAVIAANADAAVGVALSGSSGLRKMGEGTLTLTGDATHTGPTILDGGSVRYAGSASSTGNGTLTMAESAGSRAALQVETEGTLDFSGSVRIGTGDDAAAVVRQSSGTVNVGGPGVEYLQLGGGIAATTGFFGAWELSGGTLNTVGGGSPSGIRIGDQGLGNFLQTGGTLNSARWFAIGGSGGAGGEGVASFLGGAATVAEGYRFLIGDRDGSIGTLNLGTLAGGEAVVTSLNSAGLAVGNAGSTASAVLNLNAGALVLGGPLHRNGGFSVANYNGGILRAGAPGAVLSNGTVGLELVHNGGLTIDTAGNDATYSGRPADPFGYGIYPAGGGFAVPNGGVGYLAPPLVGITTDGMGSGATAIAEVEDGVVTGVLFTSPGENYEAGDTLTFTFTGGGATEPAAEFQHTLTAADLQVQGAGAIVKTGAGRLVFDGTPFHTGETRIEQGVMEINTTLDDSEVRVLPGAMLEGGFQTPAPVVVEGTFSPGSGVGSASGTGSLSFAAGSTFEIDLGPWSGESGTGHDAADFDAVAIEATAANPLTIRIDGSGLEGFSETPRELVVLTAGSITGLSATNRVLETTGFPGFGTWEVASSGGQLRLVYTPGEAPEGSYDAWISGFPGLADISPSGDPDGDGIANLLEYVLNGDPGTASREILPTAAVDGQSLVFTFIRRADSKDEVVQVLQYGSDLVGWTDLPIPDTSTGNVGITPNAPEEGLETVVVTLPASAASDGRLFARLAAARD